MQYMDAGCVYVCTVKDTKSWWLLSHYVFAPSCHCGVIHTNIQISDRKLTDMLLLITYLIRRLGIIRFYLTFFSKLCHTLCVFFFCFFVFLCVCVHSVTFFKKKHKGSVYKGVWNAKTLKLNISKLIRMQIEPYNSKVVHSFIHSFCVEAKYCSW